MKLAVNVAALRDAFPDPKPAFWNVPGDRFAYGRTARVFLPVDEGGTDRAEPGSRMFEMYLWSQLPPQNQFLPAELLRQPDVLADVNDRFLKPAYNMYGASFLQPPTPRERIQRGQFQDASRDLVTRRDAFARGQELLRNTRDADQQIRQWGEDAARLYADRGRALIDKNPGAIAEANAALDEHWAKGAGAHLLLSRGFPPSACRDRRADGAIQARAGRAAQARLDSSPGTRNCGRARPTPGPTRCAAWRTR